MGDFIDGRKAYLKKDYETAATEFKEAAIKGDTRAIMMLGWLYKKGYGVPRDIKEALRWFRLGAENGDGFSQKELGIAYMTGKGLPQDLVLAAMWLNLSKLRGYGLGDRNAVEAKLDQTLVRRARQMAEDWTSRAKNKLKVTDGRQ